MHFIPQMVICRYNPRSHTIIEAHPDVYKYMCEQGWDKKDNVRILFGRWQDVVGQLDQYDGIFFDTYSEHYLHMQEFHSTLPRILKKGSIYTFFNGLAPRCPFFSRYVCRHESRVHDRFLTRLFLGDPVGRRSGCERAVQKN